MAPKELENSQATNSAAAALAACEDLMLCILPQLPVQSICRFKSVCKSWNHLFSTQEFIKLQIKLSSVSKNQYFLVHRDVDEKRHYTISVYKFESNEKYFVHPFIHTWVAIVGCCRGLVCIKRREGFVFWNPAMNLLSKTVLPSKIFRVYEKVSVGFGYDAEGDDFKVVRIVLNDKSGWRTKCVSWVEVYSVNSDSWTTIDPGFRFSKVRNLISDVTVNGNPYWAVRLDYNNIDVLICFDMSKLIFKIVPLRTLSDYQNVKWQLEFVDWNGSLGAIVLTETDMSINVWVFDNVEQVWTKSRSAEMNYVVYITEFFRSPGTRPKGRLSMYNSESKCVKDLLSFGRYFDVYSQAYLEIYDYTPSLAYIQGMEKVSPN